MHAQDATSGSAGTAPRAFAWLIIAISACLGGIGFHDLLSPPYTDGEIRASLLDIWEPYALVTFASLALLAALSVACVAVLPFAAPRARPTVMAALTSCIIAGGLSLAAHATLTERVTALTGQHFGRFWGLL